MINCQNCRSELKPEQKFCGNCGAQVEGTTIKEDLPIKDTTLDSTSAKPLIARTGNLRKPITQTIPKSKRRKLITLSLIALLILGWVVLAYFQDPRRMEANLQQESLEEAKIDYAAHEFRKAANVLAGVRFPEADMLKDQVQFSIDSMSMEILLDSIKNTQNPSAASALAFRITSTSLYRDVVERTRPKNGGEICKLLDSLVIFEQEHKTRIDTIEYQIVEVDRMIKESQKRIAVCNELGYKRLNFTIQRRFDTEVSSGKGLYETICLDTYQRSVIVADEIDIPTNPYARMNVHLVVKDRGEQPMVLQNEYGATSQQYFKTYEVDNTFGDPEKAKSLLKPLLMFKKKFGPPTEKKKAAETKKYYDNIDRLILDPLRKLI